MIRLAAFVLLAVGLAAPAFAQERILSYDSEIRVLEDGSLDVTEHITVVAEGDQIRRGIYRDFPTRYTDRYGNRVRVGFEMLTVLRNGQPEPWFTERMSNGVRINTGDDSFLPVPAEYTFTLRYRTTRQLGFFETHDELYWNAIGTGWIFPIESAVVTVTLPDSAPAQELGTEAYTGARGERGSAYTAGVPAPSTASYQLTEPLAPGEGFTVVLTFPKGIVPQPDIAQRVGWLLMDNRGVLIALAGFLLLVTFCIRRWRRVGRDPRPGVIIPRYHPPPGESPAGLRFLRHMSYDTRCFTADLLALAVAGHLRIGSEKKRFRKTSWYLEPAGDDAPLTAPAVASRATDLAGDDPDQAASAGEAVGLATNAEPDTNRGQRRPADAPSPAQAALLEKLFADGTDRVELESENAETISGARIAHQAALDERYHPRYFRRNGGSALLAALIGIVTAVAAFALSGGYGLPVIGFVCVLMVITVIVFAFAVRAPTPEGRSLLDEIEGLKLYLSVAEKDELAMLPGPDRPPLLDGGRYEYLLPYAVALEVEEAWTGKFTDAVGEAAAREAATTMTWHRGVQFSDIGALSQAVSSSLTSQIASSSSPPGSSSGAGGGGSSGGGGGGGGGGGR